MAMSTSTRVSIEMIILVLSAFSCLFSALLGGLAELGGGTSSSLWAALEVASLVAAVVFGVVLATEAVTAVIGRGRRH